MNGDQPVFRNGLTQTAELFYSRGWFFLVPYLVLFLAFVAGGINGDHLRILFLCSHGVNAVLLATFAWTRRDAWSLGSIAFWTGLCIFFLLPGAYLEYPSDAWAHVLRIRAWADPELALEQEWGTRFAYLWSWSIVSMAPSGFERHMLGIVSASWQLLLSVQLGLFLRRLGCSRRWTRVHILAMLCLFGIGAFSFSRYYALSSTPLAYVCYLQALRVALDIVDGALRQAGWFLVLLPVIAFNHAQELLLLAIALLALTISRVTANPARRRQITLTISALFVLGVALGASLMSTDLLPDWLIEHQLLARWGAFSLWNWTVPSPFGQAAGVCGVLALLATPWVPRGKRFLAWMTAMPWILLSWPPFALGFALLVNRPDLWISFRPFYVIPGSIVLVEVLRRTLLPWVRRASLPSLVAPAAVALLMIIVGLFPEQKINGKLWFGVHRPHPTLALETMDEALEWLRAERTIDRRSTWIGDLENIAGMSPDYRAKRPDDGLVLVMDSPTAYGVGGGITPNLLTARLTVNNPSRLVPDLAALHALISREGPCWFLIPNPVTRPEIPDSRVAELTQHWSPDLTRRDVEGWVDYYPILQRLEENGWTRTSVPPYFELFEPPSKSPQASNPSP